MECTGTQLSSNKEYLREFNRKSAELHIPLAGSLDLTHRCNLRCVHCYLGTMDNSSSLLAREMTTDKMMSVIDEITEAGCLYLLLSGGEPLLRADFPHIYTHAKRNGLLVTVFTNGTLISDRELEVFETFPPRTIEISLYGATARTYELITGVPGSYERCLSGIKGLLARKVPVRLKTVLMTHNNHEFYDIEKIAEEFGVEFRFDAAIFPRLNGDQAPVCLRVPAEDAVRKEFSDLQRKKHWNGFLEEYQHQPVSDNLYRCSAGVTGFYIDPLGSLKPCLMTNNIAFNLGAGSFLEGWNEIAMRIRAKRAAVDFRCSSCEKLLFCGYCPAFFELENGREDICSEYMCSVGRHRSRYLRKIKSGGVRHAEQRA